MSRKFAASDEFIAWAQSLSGCLTTIRAKHGSIVDMVESPQWDEGKTQYALALIQSLHIHLSHLDSELTTHVHEKFGKVP